MAANKYNFTRDNITFTLKPMAQAKGLSYQPTHGSTDWGRVVSENDEILPMFHAVEIDWDGAKLQLPTYIKNKLSFDPIDDETSYASELDNYGYSYSDVDNVDNYVIISKTSQLLNIIENLANAISVPSGDVTTVDITPSIIIYPKPQSNTHEMIVKSNLTGTVNIEIYSQYSDESIKPSVRSSQIEVTANTNTIFNLIPQQGEAGSVPLNIITNQGTPSANTCVYTITSPSPCEISNIVSTAGTAAVTSNNAKTIHTITITNKSYNEITPTITATLTYKGTKIPNTPYTIVASQLNRSAMGYTTYNGNIDGTDGDDATKDITITSPSSISAKVFYYYVGWTNPTSDNLRTIVNETYETSSEDSQSVSAGTKNAASKKDRFEITRMYNPDGNNQTPIYLVVPSVQKIYSLADGSETTDTSYTYKRTITIDNVEHKVYESNIPAATISDVLIK